MSDAPPILLEEMGVRYDLRLTKKRSFRRSLISSQRLDAKGHFWALRDINLRVQAGESVAVIGPNGAGKSTLLKTLAGIITPDEGRAEVRGKIATLLQLSAGLRMSSTQKRTFCLSESFLAFPR